MAENYVQTEYKGFTIRYDENNDMWMVLSRDGKTIVPSYSSLRAARAVVDVIIEAESETDHNPMTGYAPVLGDYNKCVRAVVVGNVVTVTFQENGTKYTYAVTKDRFIPSNDNNDRIVELILKSEDSIDYHRKTIEKLKAQLIPLGDGGR